MRKALRHKEKARFSQKRNVLLFFTASVRMPEIPQLFQQQMDTLAVQLTLPTTKRVVDFHHQAIAHGGRTTQMIYRMEPSGNFSAISFPLVSHGKFIIWIYV